MFLRPFSDISYEDIERLKENQEAESDIIDYKQDFPKDDESLIKHVCAFANTRGGYLIFGVKAAGDGGCPTDICGIETKCINKEKIENKILTHVTPRLFVRIKTIQIPNTTKSILVIQIPDSYTRPHYSKNHKFYKRFHLKSEIMTEQEIADMYKNRYSNQDQVNQYVENILVDESSSEIIGNIVIIPSNIMHRLIDTFNEEKIYWIDGIRLTQYSGDHGQSIVPCKPFPSSYGLVDKGRSNNGTVVHELNIHRNGCIHLRKNFHVDVESLRYLHVNDLAIRLMESLEFACKIMNHHNYSGELKIVVTLIGPQNTVLPHVNSGRNHPNKLKVKIEREFPLEHIEQHYEQVAACIMHEVANYYGVVRCISFSDDDKWKYTRQ